MSLAELIRTRRTVGAFREEPIDRNCVETLLDHSVFAPNHKMTQPWRFVILDGKARVRYAEIRRDIAQEVGKDPVKAYKQNLAVPLFVFVLMQESDHLHTRSEDHAATAALIQNFLLLAWEQGIGTAWKSYPDDPRLDQYIGRQSNEFCAGIIQVGYPTGEGKAPPRKAAQTLITYIS